jgi:C4-dicarboxylate-specific signal transduction histidine kinase
VAVIDRLRLLFQRAQSAHVPFDLNDSVHDVLDLLAHELRRAHVEVRLELASALPRVMGDRVQVQQVVVNLLLNAVDAMSTQSTPRSLVLCTAQHDAGAVLVTVSDDGPGVPPDAHPQLFSAFYSTKPKGLGIGLAISRSIVDSHHGRLWAQPSERGATFCFTLPRASEA